MTVIQNLGVPGHGRRSEQLKLPNRGQLVLPSSELERIKCALKKDQTEELKRQKKFEQKTASSEKSKKTVSAWTNTIAGQRLMKLKAKKERDDQEEVEKVTLDMEEELYEQSRRKLNIERAKKLVFEDTTRVKEFHSALLLSETMKEREYQIFHKNAKIEKEKTNEQNYHSDLKRELEDAEEYERHRKQEKMREDQENKDALINQMVEKDEKKQKLNKEWVAEGELLAELDKDFRRQQNKHADTEKNLKRLVADTLGGQMQLNLELEKINTEHEKVENEKRQKFNDAKLNMIQLRNAKHRELFSQQQKIRGLMGERLAKEYREIEDNTEQLMRQAQEENQRNREQKQKQKEERAAKDLEEIKNHRQTELKIKDLVKQEHLKISKNELLEFQDLDEKFHTLEKLKNKNARDSALSTAVTNIEMMHEVATKERLERDLESQFDLKALEQMKLEEDEYLAYATKVIETAEKMKRNVKPMKVVKARGAGGGRGPANSFGIRPSYISACHTAGQMPTYKNVLTEEIKSNIEPPLISESKKRLGFTW